MKNTRRLFIKLSGILSLGLFNRVNALNSHKPEASVAHLESSFASGLEDKGKSIIGEYGKWAGGLLEEGFPVILIEMTNGQPLINGGQRLLKSPKRS